MADIGAVELSSSFTPFAAFRQHFGFLPSLYRRQGVHPQLLDIQASVTGCFFSPDTILTRVQKDLLILAVAAAVRNVYWVTLQAQTLSLLGVPEDQVDQIIRNHHDANLSAADQALLDFAVEVSAQAPSDLRCRGSKSAAQDWSNQAFVETVAITAWSKFLCTVAFGLSVVPDFEPVQIPGVVLSYLHDDSEGDERASSSSLPASHNGTTAHFSPSLPVLHRLFGFVPAIFKSQASWPDVITAETSAVETIFFTDVALDRTQKQLIAFVSSVAAGAGYWANTFFHTLAGAGIPETQLKQIAQDYRDAALPRCDRAVLDFSLNLALQPLTLSLDDSAKLRAHGLSEEGILEATAAVALTVFLWTLQSGFGIEDDVSSRSFATVPSKTLHFLPANSRPTQQQNSTNDPDLNSVLRVQAGDVNAFEDLMLRHHRRVHRILFGILGNTEEARDAMQETFFKAFQHLGTFERRAKFSTWLTSIAANTGMQILRERKGLSRIDTDSLDSKEDFRPRELRAWIDDPEQSCSKAELRALVERSVLGLPLKYRTVLLLRDLEQLPMEDAAACLALSLPAFKARLLRGRLLLRDALAPHFAARKRGIA